MARRPGSLIWARALLIARTRSLSAMGRAPMETRPVTRVEVNAPPAVAMVTPWTLTPARFSARSTAWAMAAEASSRLVHVSELMKTYSDACPANTLAGCTSFPVHVVLPFAAREQSSAATWSSNGSSRLTYWKSPAAIFEASGAF